MLILFCRRVEPPDVTGSSLTLGAAGSRRTVYLIDENSKLPDTSDGDLLTGGNGSQNSSPNSNNGNLSGNNNNNNNNPSLDQSPSTFLMYNRISNVIGDPQMMANGSSKQHSPNSSLTENGNGAKDRKKPDDNEKAVWYEYGCV